MGRRRALGVKHHPLWSIALKNSDSKPARHLYDMSIGAHRSPALSFLPASTSTAPQSSQSVLTSGPARHEDSTRRHRGGSSCSVNSARRGSSQ